MAKEDKRYISVLYIMTLLFCLITGIILIYGEKNEKSVPTIIETAQTRVLIIDPGHGGADGGALAPDGSKESEINLAISLKVKSLSDLLGIESVIIRESEALPYPDEGASIAEKKRWDQKRRLELINSFENAVLFSIHQNYYPDSRPLGPQVLYAASEGSEELGTLCHDMLNKHLCPQNRRVATPVSDKIFLMKNAKCTAVLVECGFMSNSDELGMLKNGEYQKQIAMIILSSYLSFIN